MELAYVPRPIYDANERSLSHMCSVFAPYYLETDEDQSLYLVMNFDPEPHVDDDPIKYIVGQHEKCPETGSIHVQFYMELSKQTSHRQLRAHPLFAPLVADDCAVHFQHRLKSRLACVRYVTKPETAVPGTRFEFGVGHQQGRRNDLHNFREAVVGGATDRDLWLDPEHFTTMLRYGRSLPNFRAAVVPRRDFVTIPIVIYGPPGTGKSEFARKLAGFLNWNYNQEFGTSHNVYTLQFKNTGLWADDYQFQHVVLIEEMTGQRMLPIQWNMMMDGDDFMIPGHGNMGVPFVARVVVVTTNYHPAFWWPKAKGGLTVVSATMRRICWFFRWSATRRPYTESSRPFGILPPLRREPQPVGVYHGPQGHFIYEAPRPAPPVIDLTFDDPDPFPRPSSLSPIKQEPRSPAPTQIVSSPPPKRSRIINIDDIEFF